MFHHYNKPIPIFSPLQDLISYEVQSLKPLVIKECAIGTGKLQGTDDPIPSKAF